MGSEQETAARMIPDAQLQVFGIDTKNQPTPTRFPKAFNAQGMKLWEQILSSSAYVEFKRKHESTSELWSFCIREFLKLSTENNVYPFTGKHDFEETARGFLEAARRKLVRWFDESGIFTLCKIKSVERDYTFTHNNFSLEVTAELRPISDPTFHAWLVKSPQPGFTKQVDGTFHRSVHAHIDVHFYLKSGVPYLRYRVFCHTPVRVLEPNAIGKAKLSKFVETKLWNPLIKQLPIGDVGNRRY